PEGVVNEFARFGYRALVDERPDRHLRFGATADLHPRHPLGDAGGEFIGDGGVHDESVRGGARLADVAEFRGKRALDRLVQVGVVTYDERGVTAQFHRGAQHAFGGLGNEQLTHRGGAGEGKLAAEDVGNERIGTYTR